LKLENLPVGRQGKISRITITFREWTKERNICHKMADIASFAVFAEKLTDKIHCQQIKEKIIN
jgi:hypothetical protein